MRRDGRSGWVWLGLLAVAACSKRGGSEGTGCTSNAECAADLFCNAGHCARPNAAPPAAPTPPAVAPPAPPALAPTPAPAAPPEVVAVPPPEVAPEPPHEPPHDPPHDPVAPPAEPAESGEQLIARFGAMPLEEFVPFVDGAFELCDRQAENERGVFRSPTRGCRRVVVADVSARRWVGDLRTKVSGRDGVRCTVDGDTERCTTPPVRNDPPHGRVWYFTAPGTPRHLLRVINWSIDG
jgi:hypothetical protein